MSLGHWQCTPKALCTDHMSLPPPYQENAQPAPCLHAVRGAEHAVGARIIIDGGFTLSTAAQLPCLPSTLGPGLPTEAAAPVRRAQLLVHGLTVDKIVVLCILVNAYTTYPCLVLVIQARAPPAGSAGMQL